MADKAVQIQATSPQILAPCGVNCSLCRAYVRARRPCPGCRGGDDHKSNACLTCAIKNCNELAAGRHRYCYSCGEFPCAHLLHLDRRYRTRYGVSVIANLERIKAVGAERVVAEERAKWTCSECGALLSMHEPLCRGCGCARQVRSS